MTTQLNVHCDVEELGYGPRDEGPYAGKLAVTLGMGSVDTTSTTQSIKAQLDSFGWTNRIRGPQVPLVITGADDPDRRLPYDPFHKQYEEAILALNEVLKPRQLWADCRGLRTPDEFLAKRFDYYTVFLTRSQIKNHADGDREEWSWFANRARWENDVDFIIETRELLDGEYIETFSQNYIVPDENIYLWPSGDTYEEMIGDYDKVVTVGKSNGWDISPRLSFEEPEPEGDDG